ncbi:RHS repeat-associated core domain-containing protein [Micromonospora sp. SCSIO 07396]
MRAVAAAAAVVMVTALAQVPGSEASAAWRQPRPKDVTGVAVKPLKHTVRPSWTAGGREVGAAGAVTWPVGDETVELSPAGARSSAATKTRAGKLPVWVSSGAVAAPATQETPHREAAPVTRARVEIANRTVTAKAGVSGLLLKVSRADGSSQDGLVTIEVDYSRFAAAYGGDWASRLRLTRVADGRSLNSRNNLKTRTVTAAVPVPGSGSASLVALAGGASGDNGDYSATSLSPAATWQVSAQTGAFSWSYALNDPPAVGGPEPGLNMSYSSGAVDGLSASTNTQGSWVGDGWNLWPGFIERKYKACADDKDAMRGGEPNNKTVYGGDQCWYKPEGNATISLNGSAVELAKSSGNTWKGVSDDGTKIELLTDTSLGNGDADGEYWKATKPDGTQYYFGRNYGPGGSSGGTATKSTWTLPVYGNHPDELGYTAGDFAASRTTQAWRWNLDYVVDRRGNTMTYFYDREDGAYGREGDKDKRTTYHRAGWLTRIEYGNRSTAAATVRPAARIVFDTADRCASNCWNDGDPVKASWPDTPWDQYCKTAPCTDQLSPTFWTAKRLATVRAQVYSGTGDTYQDVTTWTLRHTYLQAGDNEGKPMWLAGVTRTGKVTTAGGAEASDPEIVFDPGTEPLPNRVDAMADGRSNLFRSRINTITTETGAQIAVSYSAPECVRNALPTAHSNTKRCYPQYYGPKGEEPTLDWFHKYRVDRIDVYDNTGGFAHQQTNYDYLDTPAWHYDDSELVDEKKRTWGEFRGYGKVRVRTGLESGVQTATEFLYFRGMDEDKQPASAGEKPPTGSRDVWITDSQNVRVEDHEAYAGMIREETTLLGAGGGWISGTITTPSRQGPTATFGNLKAWMVNSETVRNRTKLANGTTRWTKTVTTVNSDNLPTSIDDQGDESTTTDDTCTRTWYARNPSLWLLNLPKKTEMVGVACAATATLPADLLSAFRTTYDAADNNWDTYLPVAGNVAKVEEIDAWNGTTPTWITTGTYKYDAVGRVRESTDALGRLTKIGITPDVTGPVTAITTTNPLNQSSTTTYSTAWQKPVTVTDANGIRTDLTYDGLGRLLKAWLPGRTKAANPTAPSVEHIYQVRNTAATAVTTKTLLPSNTTYNTSITLYDGLLRPRQVQQQTLGGGRVLTDTVYDSRGLLDWSTAPYYDKTNTPPNTTVYGGAGTPAVPALTQNVYDGAGRLTDAIFKVGVNETLNEKWRTTTRYEGEKTTVIPPKGAIATTTITDARGRAVTLRQYKDRANAGSDTATTFDASQYRYTDRGEIASLTDPAGNVWRYEYDQRGRKKRDEDPDRGVTTFTYDDASQLISTTDSRTKTLVYGYDNLGRKTSLRENTTTGPLRAEWTYDTLTNGIGHLTSSTRYEPAGTTNAYVTETTQLDGAGRPTENRLTIPAADSGLCQSGTLTPCTYTWTSTYRDNGTVATAEQPAAAGLPKEKLSYLYNEVGLLQGILGGGQIYLYDTVYNKLGQLTQQISGPYGKRTWTTNIIDENTGRTTNTNAIPELRSDVFNFGYEYDNAGNVEKIADRPAGGTADTQCYSYDGLRRLENAWTPANGDCAVSQRLNTNLGGPSPYWHAYTYYPGTDNRHTEWISKTTQLGPTAKTSIRTYAYLGQPGVSGSHPHAVNTVKTSVELTGTTVKTETFGYDETGNTSSRLGPNGTQTLTWDHEGKLFASADNAGTTSYVHDADGNRLIRRDPAGATLYLPGGTEVRKPTSSPATATRYYTGAQGVIAVRTSAGSLDWLVSDHHGTAEAAISNTDLSATRRRSTPFGSPRGTTPSTWPVAMDKGFLGGTVDDTGLTHLGAREYDPQIGKFISVDPVMDHGDPQQWNGYAYSHNNPATFSDPTGLIDADCAVIAGGCPDYHPGNEPANQQVKGSGGNPCWPAKCSPQGNGGQDPFNPKTWTEQMPDGRKVPSKGYVTLQVWAQLLYGANGTGTHVSNLNAMELDRARRDVFCYNFSEICKKELDDSIAAQNKFLGDLLGITDAVDCVHGSVSACAWTVIGFVPIGKLKAAGTIGKALYKSGKTLCSFGGETQVLMADGSSKPISDVRVGDKVLATDPETGETSARPVTHTWIHEDGLRELKVGGSTVATTEDHPFWVASEKRWLGAGKIKMGQKLSSTEGREVASDGVAAAPMRLDIAYNLTVGEIDTYYVFAGNTPILVHNCGETIKAGDLEGLFTPGQLTRDPASQWYHEMLENDDLLGGINSAEHGDGILVSRDGLILGGHHRLDEVIRRVKDGRLDPDTPITIQRHPCSCD